MPRFPTPKGQSLKAWLEVFKEYEKFLGKDTIIIGHSLGPAFALSVIEKSKQPIRAAFFVSGFIGKIGNLDFDKINSTFAERKFDWKKIKKNCGRFEVLHSDNDPYVPLSKAEELAQNLGVKPEIIKGAGHFNTKAGYAEFRLLLEKILKF